MPYETPMNTKPVVDALNDAVSALTDLVRSLRATAKAAKKTHSKEAKKAGKAKDLRARLERAWEVFAHGKGDANGSTDNAGASRARPKRPAARGRGARRGGARARVPSTQSQAP